MNFPVASQKSTRVLAQAMDAISLLSSQQGAGKLLTLYIPDFSGSVADVKTLPFPFPENDAGLMESRDTP